MMRRSARLLEKLVIVESPNKVIKVEGILSDPKVVPDWSFKRDSLKRISTGAEKAMAMATTGHFMALQELTWTPQPMSARPVDKDDTFPANGVLASFALEWEIIAGRRIQETVSHYIKEKAEDLSEIIVATDPDREGELIAVHALNLIKSMFPDLRVPFTRAYMHSITVDGIRTAMRERKELFNHHLANAAEARHAMDRIFGFLGSSVVRFANPKMRSIGRVQTPALILIHEREKKIANFIESHKLVFQVRVLCSFAAANGTWYEQLVHVRPSRESDKATVNWEDSKAVEQLCQRWALESGRRFHVKGTPVVTPNVTEPPEPFTMASLISKANRQLHLSSECVSSCLQDLFQMGHITYPRTDSVRIDETALPLIYDAVKSEFGSDMLYRLEDRPALGAQRVGGGKKQKDVLGKRKDNAVGGNVEDAHEAIRPTDIKVRVGDLGQGIASDTKLVYDLIRRNTLAAFMIPMKTERVLAQVGFTAGSGDALEFYLEGKHTVEAGWSAAFRVGTSRASQTAAETQIEAEAVEKGHEVVSRISDDEFKAIVELRDHLRRRADGGVKLKSPRVQEHRPTPPLPYSEGGLIEELKNNGVGRPSTYPMIVRTLLARNYITVDKGRCESTPIGRLLVETSKSTFPSIVDIGFTASFERKLDRVAKPEQHKSTPSQQPINLSEADVVLSSFVSTFLNYVTEATRTQRANIAARSFTLKHEELRRGGESDDEATFDANLKKECQRAMTQVPDLIDASRHYRTFTALQNCLSDYLRRHFPPSPPVSWEAENGAAPPSFSHFKRPLTKYTSYTKYANRKAGKRSASRSTSKVAKAGK